jgi:HK97 family phage portal protein
VYGLPAAWRCLNWICNAVASCAPPQVHGAEAGVRLEAPPVVDDPWPLLTSHEFWRAVAASLVLHGNFVGYPTDWDPVTGWPRQVVPLDPRTVEFQIVDGRPVYRVGDTELGALDVIHVRGYTPPGHLWGVGVIEAFRNTIAEGGDHQDWAQNIYAGSGVPPLVIEVDSPDLTETQAGAIQSRFNSLHKGGNKLPAVLPSSMDVRTLAFSPADAQFLESRKWNATEIAWMFGMDPADLGVSTGGASLTYANLDQRSIERLTHVLGPWLRPIEQTWSLLLPGRQKMRFNVENLLRTETKTRLEASKLALDMGLFTLNDARRIEKLPPFGAWADEPFGHPGDQASRDLGLAELVQKVYLGVGKVITSDEARSILNATGGAELEIPGPDFGVGPAGGDARVEQGRRPNPTPAAAEVD